jgi:hypothetical protein
LTAKILSELCANLSRLGLGTPKYWIFLETQNTKFITQKIHAKIEIPFLKILAAGFSRERQGTPRFWALVNEKILNVFLQKNIRKYDFYDIIEIMNSLSFVRRGEKGLWLEFEVCLRFFSQWVSPDVTIKGLGVLVYAKRISMGGIQWANAFIKDNLMNFTKFRGVRNLTARAKKGIVDTEALRGLSGKLLELAGETMSDKEVKKVETLVQEKLREYERDTRNKEF